MTGSIREKQGRTEVSAGTKNTQLKFSKRQNLDSNPFFPTVGAASCRDCLGWHTDRGKMPLLRLYSLFLGHSWRQR